MQEKNNSVSEEVIPESANNFEQSNSGIAKKPVKKNHKVLKAFSTGVLVIMLGVGSGFGGAYLYNQSFGTTNSDQAVIYQSTTAVSTNTVTTNELSTAQVVNEVKDSVVEIVTESVTTSAYLGKYVTSGAGSGVIITANGYIVTNSHVISGANKITVTLSDGNSYNAELVGKDTQSDLAIIKIDASGLSAAVLGESDSLSVGQNIIAIGNPLGSLGGTVTTGIVSALSRDITIDGNTMNLLQISAAVNPGNSGGGLFDQLGNLVGIVNAKSSGSDIEGIGFAIPIDQAKSIIEELINSGYVSGRVRLGIAITDVLTQQAAYQYGVSELGVYISSVEENSNAAKGGLKVGDLLVSIDGENITSSETATTIIKSHSIGDKVVIVVKRNGQKRTVNITIEESPNN